MNTMDCFDRLAKVGVVVDGLSYRSEQFIYRPIPAFSGVWMQEDHAELLLEAAVHRKWPTWVCRELHGVYEVYEHVERGGTCCWGRALTRLAALTLAAERGAKEKA